MLSDHIRITVYSQSHGLCHYCDTTIIFSSFHVDHKIPKYSGGSDELENLVASCAPCNIAKFVRPYEDFKRILKEEGLKWRDREFNLNKSFKKFQNYKGTSDKGVSQPLIGFRKRQEALLRKARALSTFKDINI